MRISGFCRTRGGNRTRLSDIQSLLYAVFQDKYIKYFNLFGGTFGGSFNCPLEIIYFSNIVFLRC